MMKRRITTVFAAAAGFVLLSAGAAYAHDQLVTSWNNGYERGYAKWTENGDSLLVCDEMADGWGIRGYIFKPTDIYGNGTVILKVNDSNSTDGCVSVSKNVDETTPLGIKVCTYAGSEVSNCDWEQIPR